MRTEFFQTVMGRKYYEGDVPNVRRSLESIAKSLEALAAQEAKEDKDPTLIKVHMSEDEEPGLEVFIKGMGTSAMAEGHGCPVFLEFYEGKWTLHVWADINREDATHRIDLTGALESNRIDDSARAEVERQLHRDGIIEDPDIDGGLMG